MIAPSPNATSGGVLQFPPMQTLIPLLHSNNLLGELSTNSAVPNFDIVSYSWSTLVKANEIEQNFIYKII